jgi:hypothetical protein
MSVWNRMRQLQMEEDQSSNPGESSTQTSKSSTLESASPPAVLRLRAVLAELTSFVGSRGTGKQKRMAFVMRRIATDVCEELQESDPETISAYFDQMGQVISWIGTGDDDSLPSALKELFLPRAAGIRAITSGENPEDSLHYDRETGELERLGPEPGTDGESSYIEDVVAASGGVNP